KVAGTVTGGGGGGVTGIAGCWVATTDGGGGNGSALNILRCWPLYSSFWMRSSKSSRSEGSSTSSGVNLMSLALAPVNMEFLDWLEYAAMARTTSSAPNAYSSYRVFFVMASNAEIRSECQT